PKEVDHYIEVAVDPAKAYDWDNLYLSCLNCNDKLPHNDIPVTDALNPCVDSDDTIRANLTFKKEIICAVPDSPKGLNTIQKFRLDTELLDAQRAKWLNGINETIINILKTMIKDCRKELNESEIIRLKEYMQPTAQFSLMSRIFITERLGGLLP
ncbi:MAG: HNH endonuclease, partial [Muribaculaceae bacterium]|nr:HNH endonuclease [Muribaculaceae bacterium]